MLDNKYPITQQFKNSDMHNSPVRFFSYDLSELRFKANAARHQSLRTRLYSNNFRTSNKLPFRIIKNTSVKPEPLGKINIKLNKEGVEMNNAIKRRKESQKQHEQIQNRIKHLQDAERREIFKAQRIQAQIDKFNTIRKVKSEYMQKRKEDMYKYKVQQELKKKQVKDMKNSILDNLKLKKEEILVKNRKLMEEVLRENDQMKLKKK